MFDKFRKQKRVCPEETKLLEPREVKQIMEEDREGLHVVVDIRKPEEYVAAHLYGAVSIPLEDLKTRYRELRKGKKIIVYGQSGNAVEASAVLCKLGFETVYTMNGGILNWNYDVVKEHPAENIDLFSDIHGQGVFLFALRMEEGSFELYSRAKEKARDPRGAEVFESLVQMEKGHMQKIYSRLGWVLTFGTMELARANVGHNLERLFSSSRKAYN